MISKNYVTRYCREDIGLIENYEDAINDDTHVWHIHHRNEIIMNKSKQELIQLDLYYDRPASELIFLTPSEHARLHFKNEPDELKLKFVKSFKGKHHSDEAKDKMSKAQKSRFSSPDEREKVSKVQKNRHISLEERAKCATYGFKGKHHTDETKTKLSVSHKGKHLSNEQKLKISASLKGKHHTDETKTKMSAAAKARFNSPEEREKISKRFKGKHLSKVTRAKLSKTKPKYRWIGSDGDIIVMDKANAARYHPDYKLLSNIPVDPNEKVQVTRRSKSVAQMLG